MSEINEELEKLTRHREGSVRELFAIAVPLMFSILSGGLMMFIDRIILAKFSLTAMNAVAAAGLACAVMQFGAIGVASIAEVFVGQNNGAKKYSGAAAPAWQMVWFSLFMAVPFLAAALWLGPYVLSDYHYSDMGLPYFRYLLYFGPIFSAQAAFSSFFIGTGKTRIVAYAAIAGNIANVILDILLIFGVPNFIPALGTKGAAIATGVSQCIQVLILLVPFFGAHCREKYHTADCSFKPKLFMKCIKVGFPSALGHMIEISAWALIARMLTTLGDDYITVQAVGQSFFALIAFGMEALQKAVTTLAANFIGAKRWDMVHQMWRSAVKLLGILAILFSTILVIYPDPIIRQFLSGVSSQADASRLFSMLKVTGVLVWTYFVFDSLTWISAGVLMAAGDTFKVMLINVASNWVFALVPTYFFIVHLRAAPIYSWVIGCVYAMVNALLFYLMYRQGGWKQDRQMVLEYA